MSKPTIATNTSITTVLENLQGQTAPLPEQHLSGSSTQNWEITGNSCLPVLSPAFSGPSEAVQNAENGLITAAQGLNPDLSPESVQVLKNFIARSSRGFAGTMPMICKGMQCPFIHSCPLQEAKSKLPVGQRCPVEESIVYMWVNKHLNALGIENIDAPENSFDMDMLYELAGQELIRWRCGSYMAKNPNIVEAKMVGESFQGTPLFADIMNPVIEAMERAGKNVAKIRDALLATRKAQITAGQVAIDATQKAAELRKKAAEINKMRRQLNSEKIRDADFTIKDEFSK
jgi:hypothetical protein